LAIIAAGTGDAAAGVEDIALEAGKAHSLFMDTVFSYAFWTLLIVMVIGLAVAILVW